MIGLRIAVQRKKLGISQAELAQRLCVSASAVGMYEQGRRLPSAEILSALSDILDVSIDYLVTGRDWVSQKPLPSPDPVCISRQELKQLLLGLLQED